MVSQDRLMKVLNGIEADVTGFIAGSIVDADSGMALATRSRRADFDLEIASAYNTEMIKAKQKTIRVLNLEGELEDMLLTLSDQLHLIKMLNDQMFLYVAADRQETNLALLRMSVNQNTRDVRI